MPIVNCATCFTSFSKTNSQIKRTKSGNHFCSRSCSATHNNIGVVRNKVKKIHCSRCSSVYIRTSQHHSKKYCNKCSNVRLRTIKECYDALSVKNKHPSWKSSNVRVLNRSWNKNLLLLPCKNCGYDKHVELCHIKAISQFDDSATLGEINHPDNNVQLCRNCHWEFDHGQLQI